MSKDTDSLCFSCRFYQARKHDNLGWCKRYAPRPTAIKIDADCFQREASFPIVSEENWCGEFEKRKGDKR